MTFVDEVEVRRASVGTKVLAFACGILAVLGSFWAIVWFIRAYVEAPRVNIPAPMVLAASESRPAPVPESRPVVIPKAAPAGPILEAQAKPTPTPAPAAKNSPAASRDPEPSASGAVADRWFPMNQLSAPVAPPPPPAPITRAEPPVPPVPTEPAAATAANTADTEPPIEEVAEGSVPAIAGPAPLPRPKPIITAARRIETTTPLPRPRPDGPAPQSVWTGVPATDERFNAQ